MKRYKILQSHLVLIMLILSILLGAGCGHDGGSGSSTSADTTNTSAEGLYSIAPLVALVVLASDYVWNSITSGDNTAPTVTAVAPLNNATGVAIDTKTITAAFSEPMDPTTLTTASFTLECPSGTPVTGGGAVTYLLAGRVATLPLPAATNLPPSTVCTATITTGAEDLAGNALAGNLVWTFTTGVTPDNTAPTVTAVVPLNNATGVAIDTKTITAAFSEPMDPTTLTTASFTLECPSGTPVTGGGAVTYLLAGRVATLPLPAATNLPPSTVCTATITTGAEDLAGNALAGNLVWTFTTGVTPDNTRPRVISTFPATTIPGPTNDVPTNTAITAIFSEDMDPATISSVSFTLTGPGTTPVAARALNPVTYVVGSRTAIFWPAAVLKAGTTYTATITTAARDIAGNQLAGNQAALPAASKYEWTFTTAAAAPSANIYVSSPNPASGALDVCPNAAFNATFIVPSGLRIDPSTINGTFIGPDGDTAGTISLDAATGRVVSFTPFNALTVGTYTVTIYGGVNGIKDLAIPANTMTSDYTSTFTVVATGLCLAIPVHSLASFGVLSCAALSGSTMEPTGTTVNGDIGTTLTHTSITNFVGGGPPATPGIVNGTIYAADLPTAGDAISSTAVYDAYILFQILQSMGATGTVIPSSDLGAIAGFGPAGVPGTFYTGIYHSATSMAISTPMTLDAQGNANAVWIFEMGSTLTTSALGNIILKNNAQAKNVFWVVGSSATLGAPAFSGNILAATAISVGTVGVTVDGRLLVSGPTCDAVMFDAHLHTVNVPAP